MASVDSTGVLKKILLELRSSDLKIGDKYRKLNEFVKEARYLNFAEIKELVNPVDFFSRRICMDLAIALRNMDYLVHLLKTAETSILRSAMRKNAWLYTANSRLTDPDFLVNDLFPVISFTCRQIILTKLPHYLNDEERCAKIFETVGAKYGFENTGDLIVGCSPAYILEATKVKKITLTNRQLKPLLKKHPKFVQDYLVEFYNSKNPRGHNLYHNMLQYIAHSHPAVLMNLLDTYAHARSFPGLSLKPEVSSRLLRFGKAKILANPEKYLQFIDKNAAYKQLTKDEYMFLFASVWPASIQEFQKRSEFQFHYYLFPEWLKPIPSTVEKGELVQKIFLAKYGALLLEHENCIFESILKLLPAHDRTKVVESKILKSKGAENQLSVRELGTLIAFKSIDKSIPEIKELIFHESDAGTRIELINCLIDTCAVNEDKAALREVCKYYVTRHRNEQEDIHSRILFNICESFELLEFNSETWSAFFGIIQLVLLAQNDDTYYQCEWSEIIEHLYVFQTLNPVDAATFKCNEMFLRLLRWKISGSEGYDKRSWEIEQIRKKGLSLKDFFGVVMKELEACYPKEKPEKYKSRSNTSQYAEERIISILSSFNDWNKQFCGKQVRVSVKDFPWVEDKVSEILANHEDFPRLDHLISLLMSDPVLKRDEAALRKYLEICTTQPLMMYFLRNDPKTLVQNWEAVQTCLLSLTGISKSESVKYVELLKYHGYTELSKKLIEKCKSQLGDKSAAKSARSNAVDILSVLMDSADFLDIMTPYFPQTSTIDPSNEADVLDMGIRTRIAASLKNLEYPSDGFSTLLKFCIGDYLKFSVGSLCSLSCKAGQGNLLSFLKELTQRAVSVKKHAIRLICLVSTQQEVCDCLKALSDTEKNGTIRHVILKNIFKTVNISTWPVLKSAILTVGEKETDSIGELSGQDNISRIPNEVMEEYFTIVWKVLQNLDVKEQYKPTFVYAIGQNQERLPKSFTKAFVQAHLFSSELTISVQNAVTTVFVQYLLNTVSTSLEENLTILQQGLENLCSPEGNILKNKSGVLATARNHNLLNGLIDTLASALHIDDSTENKTKQYPKELFQGLLNLPVFSQHPFQTFGEYLSLQFLIIFHLAEINKNKDYVSVGRELAKLLDVDIEKYGKEIFPLFKAQLQASMISIHRQNSDIALVDLITGLLESKSGNPNERNIMALNLLPKNPDLTTQKSSEAETKEKFKRILETIFNSQDPLIKVHVYNWVAAACHDAPEHWNELFRGVQ